jgi:hypothetical protein
MIYSCQLTKQKNHGLTRATVTKRLKRAKSLLRHAGDEIFFSDEKMFVLEQQLNVQNDKVCSLDTVQYHCQTSHKKN